MKHDNTDILDLISQESNVLYLCWDFTPNKNISFVSQNITRLLGYRHDLVAAGAITFESIIYEDDLFEYEIELALVQDDSQLSEIKHAPFRIKHANGNLLWFQQTTSIKRDDDLNIVVYLASLSFASELVELKQELDDANKRLLLATKTSGVGTWELNIQSGAVCCDLSWCTLLGFSTEIPTISLTRIFAMVHPDDLHEFKFQLEQFITSKSDIIEILVRFRHIDNSWRYLLTKGVVAESDIEGKPLSFIASQTDITKQKQTELMAVDALSSRNQFFARVSHEIRTPMHGILGILNLLKKDIEQDSARTQIEKVIENSEQLLFLLNDILDLAKLNETQITINAELCSITEIVKQVHRLFKDKANDKSLGFELDIQLGTEEFVIVDKVRLTQVLSNIVSNALKFTQRGFIKLVAFERQGFISVDVSDTGTGIKDVEGIFDAYVQERKNQSDQSEGTGLGLEIVKRLCDLMNIKIDVKSSEKGTSFIFEIGPSNTGNLVSANIDAKTLSNPEKQIFDRLPILVVDDSEINREIAEYVLLERGAIIHTANNGHEAIKKVARHPDIKVILMDKHMPVMDGVEATAQIQAMYKGKDMPIIIALTADAFEVDNQTWFKYGLSDLITKPFDAFTLCKKIADAVNAKQSSQT